MKVHFLSELAIELPLMNQVMEATNELSHITSRAAVKGPPYTVVFTPYSGLCGSP